MTTEHGDAKDQAELEKAQAEAASAKAAAEKAQAEADSARAAASKAEEELQEWASSWSKAQREAAALKETAESRKAEIEADIAGFVPDFGSIADPDLEVKGDQMLYAGRVVNSAITSAAATLRKALEEKVKDKKVLITDDPDLTTSDMAYFEVKNGLARLDKAAAKVIGYDREEIRTAATGVLTSGLAALASALPSVASLLLPKRILSTGDATLDREVVLASVAGEIVTPAMSVRIDDFRTIPDGQIRKMDAAVQTKRNELAVLRLELASERADAASDKAVGEADLAKAAEATPPDPERVANLKKAVARAVEQIAEVDSILAMVDSLLSAIDEYSGTIHKAVSGGRSLFVEAALGEQLHKSVYDYILLAKGTGGSAAQLISDLPLWSSDRFSVVGDASIAYWLSSPAGDIVAAGVAVASTELNGKVGEVTPT